MNNNKNLLNLKKELQKKDVIINKLNSLVNVSSIIVSSLDKKRVLKSILNQTKILMECKKSSVLLVDTKTNQLYFDVLSSEQEMKHLSSIRLNKGEGIAGTVWQTGKPLLIEDVAKDKRFSQKVDKKLDNVTKSLIAVPLIVNNNVIGVMEAINKKDDTSFYEFDLEIFRKLSVQAAIAIDNAKLYELAITDGMTNLFIHRYFKTRIHEEFNRSKRYNRDLSLIMLDIDHFKMFNDNYGHQIGDQVLVTTANLIKKKCRTSDIPARYGGEEFVIILPETPREGTINIAERIRNIIEKTRIEIKNKIVNLTISAGIASFKNNNPSNPEEFIKMADSALYFSKNNGRNKVSFYELNM